MRIRKRPSFPSSSSLATQSLSPDLPHQVPQANGSLLGAKITSAGGGPAGGKQELHQDGDLPIESRGSREASFSTKSILPHPSGPCSDAKSRRRRRRSSQVLVKEEEKEEEEEEWTVDFNSNKRRKGHGSSSMSKSGSSGAVASGATQLQEQEKKIEARERAFASGSASNNCTSVHRLETEHKEARDGGAALPVATAGTKANKGSTSRPPVLMEGSRCSRVNGRGWRCCQPTLVGYSLCEHHLGKGRLRSVSTAVRGQLGTSKHKWRSTDGSFVAPSIPLLQQEEEEKKRQRQQAATQVLAGREEEIDQRMEGKRKKTSTVKARSLSSLLDDHHHTAMRPLF